MSDDDDKALQEREDVQTRVELAASELTEAIRALDLRFHRFDAAVLVDPFLDEIGYELTDKWGRF
jgi:hypothetical protein